MEDALLSFDHTVIAQRAANEGVPVGAIARILQRPFAAVLECLKDALSLGRVGTIPKSDWPPTARDGDRCPSVPRTMNVEDIEFHCKRVFKLTNLEAGFVTVLLRYDFVDKERLHAVCESQRFKRQQRSNEQSVTDVKIVDVVVCKLRKKLRDIDPFVLITTSWGKGYYFEPHVKEKVFKLVGGNNGRAHTGRGTNTPDTDRPERHALA